MTTRQRALSQWQLAPFHIGGGIGPISNGVLAVLFTVMMHAFDVDRAVLSLALPVYMIPFAGVQLISGGISDLTSRRSAIVLGFAGYGLASLVSGLAPGFGLYLVGQALMGITNAFTTPILMATLGDVVPDERMGRTMGTFSAANLAGAMAGPLLAGALGGLSWRLVYVAITVLSWALVVWYLFWFRRHGETKRQRSATTHLSDEIKRLSGALGWPLVLLAGLAFLANGAMRGPFYLFGDYLGDAFGNSVGAAGLILALYGLAGLIFGPWAGVLVDRLGVYPCVAASTVGVAASLLLMRLAASPLIFAAGNFFLGVTGIVTWSALATLTLRSSPEHRGTTSSIFGSARFMAQAISPFWYTPLYQAISPGSIFTVAAITALLALVPLGGLHRRAGHQRAAHDTDTDTEPVTG